MKKLILGLITLVSSLSMTYQYEANIKVGYDFFRASTDKLENKDLYSRGFVVGLEALPLTFIESKIKIGAGFEYNFGETTLHYINDNTNAVTTFIPLYATAKFTYYRHKNKDFNLYTFGRLGYAFSKEKTDMQTKKANGVYYGLGLGLDYKYFLTEILYDGKYSTDIRIQVSTPGRKHDFMHKVGIRLGLQI